jgi:hypothetical protein
MAPARPSGTTVEILATVGPPELPGVAATLAGAVLAGVHARSTTPPPNAPSKSQQDARKRRSAILLAPLLWRSTAPFALHTHTVVLGHLSEYSRREAR